MLYFIEKVACIVTDSGVEIHILEVVWIFDAFLFLA